MSKIICFITTAIFVSNVTSVIANDSLYEEIAEKEKVDVAKVKESLEIGCHRTDIFSLNECARYSLIGADLELNRAYKELISNMSRPQQLELQKDQRIWLKARDQKCRKEIDEEIGAGPMWAMYYNACLEVSTKKRTEYLRQWRK